MAGATAMMIDGGKLDRKLDILSAGETQNLSGEPITDAFGQVITDEFGQDRATFATVRTIRAQRLDMRTQDAARAGARETFAMARFLIRYREDISTAMRVRSDGKLYDIKAIDEPDRRASLILTVEEVTRD